MLECIGLAIGSTAGSGVSQHDPPTHRGRYSGARPTLGWQHVSIRRPEQERRARTRTELGGHLRTSDGACREASTSRSGISQRVFETPRRWSAHISSSAYVFSPGQLHVCGEVDIVYLVMVEIESMVLPQNSVRHTLIVVILTINHWEKPQMALGQRFRD